MRKWLKVVLIGTGILAGLIILLWLGLSWFIHHNRKVFLAQVTEQLNERLNGTITIGDMEPALIRSFPDISVALKKVIIRDSSWAQHRHDFLDASYIFVRVNTLSLLRKNMEVKEVTVQDAAICLFTDSTGYSNTAVFGAKPRTYKTPRQQRFAKVKAIHFNQVKFKIENHQKQKLFELDLQKLEGRITPLDSNVTFNANATIFVKHFEFNTAKGSYLKDKTLRFNWKLSFHKRTRVLTIPQQELRIDEQPLQIGGTFAFGEKPPAFKLKINGQQLPLKTASTFLSPNISSKLNLIELSGPLDVQADLEGHMKYRDTPRVLVTWQTRNNTLVTGMGEWKDCTFSGRFNNEVIPGNGHNDENSAVSVYGLKASLAGVPVQSDTIRVVNLKHPLLKGHFTSAFPLKQLNGSLEVFSFSNGNARVNLVYTGAVLRGDKMPSRLEGTVLIDNAALRYEPRNLAFHNCNALLRFTGEDLLLENISIRSEKSSLQMEGEVKNMLNLYFTAPEKIVLNWRIRSPLIDLNEFRSFLVKRGKAKVNKTQTRRKMSRVAHQLDAMLASGNVNMNVLLDKIVYQRFDARQVKADITLSEDAIALRNISLQHAGGSMQVKGTVNTQGSDNRFKLNAGINNVHISQLFYAFNNFDMQQLRSENLRGIVSATVNLSGNILDNGTMAPHSLYGNINFNLKNGALLRFGPLEEIGRFVFRRRHLDSITFANLSNNFQLKGGKIIIPPMRIASSAINIDMEGVYGLKGGTKINLDIPLRNPQKDSAISDRQERRKRSRKGIVLHLRAEEDKSGKVKIKLGNDMKKEDIEEIIEK